MSVYLYVHLSDIFPDQNGLKKGNALSPLLFNFALEYAIRMVQESQVELKLSWSQHRLVCADGANLLRVDMNKKEKGKVIPVTGCGDP
jgi:hypothetical protein